MEEGELAAILQQPTVSKRIWGMEMIVVPVDISWSIADHNPHSCYPLAFETRR